MKLLTSEGTNQVAVGDGPQLTQAAPAERVVSMLALAFNMSTCNSSVSC